MYFFQASKRPSTAPVDPSRRLSVTERKFGYTDLLEEIGVPQFLVVDETDADGDLSTVLVCCASRLSAPVATRSSMQLCHQTVSMGLRRESVRQVQASTSGTKGCSNSDSR